MNNKSLKKEWLTIKSIACAIVNASAAGAKSEVAKHSSRMRKYLKQLLKQSPNNARLTATLGDYTPNVRDQLRLLKRAYRLSSMQKDNMNSLLIAVDISGIYLDELDNRRAAKSWLRKAQQLLLRKNDSFARREIRRLERCLR